LKRQFDKKRWKQALFIHLQAKNKSVGGMEKGKIILLTVLEMFLLSSAAYALTLVGDSTGGDCELQSIGTWNPDTNTCTLTKNLSQGVMIDSSYVTLDCDGHKIIGTGSGKGVYTYNYYKNYLTVNNCDISGFGNGIYLYRTTHSDILNNKVHSNASGIYVYAPSGDILISENLVYSNNSQGIQLQGSSGSDVNKNRIYNNGGTGFYLNTGSSNKVFDNVVFSNGTGFNLYLTTGNSNNEFFHNDIESNGTGIYIYTYTTGRVYEQIYQNNFIENTTQFLNQGQWTKARITDPLDGLGNYWSDYTGQDIDADGVGDTELPWQGFDNYPLMEAYGWSSTLHCRNGIQDGDETDTDCGGSCLDCEEGRHCLAHEDCLSSYCSEIYDQCIVPGDLYMEWIKPIQVIEGVPLVSGKATVVRVKVVNNGPHVKTNVNLNYGGCYHKTLPVTIPAYGSKIVNFYPLNNCTQ